MPLPTFVPEPIEEDSEYAELPKNLLHNLHRYVQEGRGTGDFLTALLTNDLGKAVAYADNTNQRLLVPWVKYVFNRIPATCHGSKEAVRAWRQLEEVA